MTSDAKIGLLLGLVFIFIIAFIINGLPSLGQNQNPNKLTTNMVNSQNGDSGPLAHGERQAHRRIISQPEASPAQTTTNTDKPNSTLRPANIAARQTPLESEVRFRLPLADDTQIDRASEIAVQTEEPAQQNQDSTADSHSESEQKTYVVRSGDNLAKIAQAVYGQTEGNRRKNIERIFQANSDELNSPDQIVVGQELVIPPLEGGQFEVVSSIGRRHSSSSGQRETTSRTYTVRSGDSLWRIAQQQLGDGDRYKEIIDLNERKLSNPNNLKEGDQIIIPGS